MNSTESFLDFDCNWKRLKGFKDRQTFAIHFYGQRAQWLKSTLVDELSF